MRGAAGHEQVHREDSRDPAARLWALRVQASRDRAGAHRDHELRRRHRLIRLLQGQAHVSGHGPGHEKPVGVTGRCDERDAESPDVPPHGGEDVGVRLARIAAAGAHLAQPQRPAEQPAQLSRHGIGEPQAPVGTRSHAPARSKPIVPRERDRARRAGLRAVGAEQAPAEVHREPAAPGRRREWRSLPPGQAAAHSAQPSAHSDASSRGRPRNLSGRAGGRFARKPYRAVALSQPRADDIHHSDFLTGRARSMKG